MIVEGAPYFAWEHLPPGPPLATGHDLISGQGVGALDFIIHDDLYTRPVFTIELYFVTMDSHIIINYLRQTKQEKLNVD